MDICFKYFVENTGYVIPNSTAASVEVIYPGGVLYFILGRLVLWLVKWFTVRFNNSLPD